MISHSLLYLNVMSFGSLMTVFLTRNGVDEYDIGVAQGVASIIGFFGVTAFPLLDKWIGLQKAATCAIWYFVLTCGLGMSFVLGKHPEVWGFTVCIICSRCGLWVFDLCTRQIVQERVEESARNRSNGHWNSMISGFDMTSFALAIVISGDNQFRQLCVVSFCFLLLSALNFSVYNSTSQKAVCDVDKDGFSADAAGMRSKIEE